MTNILIVGIGGIGGFFGGKLCQAFHHDPNVHIHFMARGEAKSTIAQSGITVKSDTEHFVTSPRTVSDRVDELGEMDYIILCTKSYDLEATARSLTTCISGHTVIVPLLNGVDSRQRITDLYPHNLVTDGCANIIARRTSPGQVEVFSTFKTLHFGCQATKDPRLEHLYKIFQTAGIDATLTDNIWKAIWVKFIFISSAATITTYYDKSFGQIREEPTLWAAYRQLVDEIQQLAQVKSIELPDDVQAMAYKMFQNAPFDATTSMHTDFKTNSGRNELRSLCGYVVDESVKLNIAAPTYQKMYTYLSNPDMAGAYTGSATSKIS